MTFRKILFWLHLTAGVVAGVVILIMSITGVLLMYEKQIVAWADQRQYRAAPRPGAQRMPIEALIAKGRDFRHAMPATITLSSDPTAPATLAFGRDQMLFLNPYTGHALGEGAPQVRRFFHVITDWHRWLGAHGESRRLARAVTGACNLAFLFLVLSGVYLWWPRKWSWPAVRAVTWFRGGLSGKARDFNWHNVIGLWCCIPLFFIVSGAVVISYPWASNLVYRLTGSEPPAQGLRPGAAVGEPTQASRAKQARGNSMRGAPAGFGPMGFIPPPIGLNLDGIDNLWRRAERQVPSWRTISLRLPASDQAPLTFTIDQGTAGQPQKRALLTLNRRTGEVQRWETFSSYELGRRVRSWLRFVHTGEYYGWIGQTIAGIASAGGALLMYTGLALAVRRWIAWLKRRSAASEKQERVLIER